MSEIEKNSVDDNYEHDFDETQKFIQMVMRTIFATILWIGATALRFAFHVRDWRIDLLLLVGLILVCFYIWGIIVTIKDRKGKGENHG